MKKDMVVCYTKIINLQKSTLKSIIYSPNFTTNDLNTECVMSSTLEEKTHEKKKAFPLLVYLAVQPVLI